MINNIGTLRINQLQRKNFSQLTLSGNVVAIDLDELFTRQQLLHPNFFRTGLGKDNRVLGIGLNIVFRNMGTKGTSCRQQMNGF